jgi:omega-amidase
MSAAGPDRDLRLTLVQAELAWEDPAANREAFDRRLYGLEGRTDLVLLPEMFATGFTMDPAPHAEPMDGPTVAWMAETAARLDAVVAGSLVIASGEGYRNRLVWMRPDGTRDHYDKRHLFTYAGEHERYAPGRERLVTAWRGWRVCPLVCYDLRFPVWSRNHAPGAAAPPYDLLLYVANWPARRGAAWSALLAARAIENMAWTAGLNRVGEDGNGIGYDGRSALHDPLGEPVWQARGTEAVHTLTLSAEGLRAARERFRFLDDRDGFTLDD